MPLVVVCGRPCAGKSLFAAALARHLEAAGSPAGRVVLINDESLGVDKATAYSCKPRQRQALAVWRVPRADGRADQFTTTSP